MKELNRRKLPLLASFVLLIGAPLVVDAAYNSSDSEKSSRHVSYADLNLDSKEGIVVLYRRLQRASRDVCDAGRYLQKGPVKEVMETRACYRQALSRSVAKFDNARLTAIHEA